MKFLGKFCLAVSFPASIAGGYGIYAISKKSSEGIVHKEVVMPVQEQTGSESKTIEPKISRDEGVGAISSETVNSRLQESLPKEPTIKWIFGESENKQEQLVIEFKKAPTLTGETISFDSGFNILASGRTLGKEHFLCTFSNKGKFFVMQYDSSARKHKTIDGSYILPCGWYNKPNEKVAKYSITEWSELNKTKPNPLKDRQTIDIKTCSIVGNNKSNEIQRLQMSCKESSNSMRSGRPKSDIHIEVRGVKVES